MPGPLAVRVSGQEGAPALVLLHSIATNAEMWALQRPVWSERWRVIAVDLPGHGASPVVEGGLDGFADAVVRTLEGLGVAQAAVVGLSLGGMVAQTLAIRHPQVVRAAVFSQTFAKAGDPVKAMWAERITAVGAGGMASQVESTLSRWFTEPFRAASPATIAWIERMIRETPVEGFVAAAGAIQGLDNLGRFGEVAAPVLVVAGEDDKAATPEVARDMAGRLKNGRLAVVPGSHLANVERPAEFTEAVAAFLSDVF